MGSLDARVDIFIEQFITTQEKFPEPDIGTVVGGLLYVGINRFIALDSLLGACSGRTFALELTRS